MQTRTSRGFTLIELLIVIALIAVLAGAVIIALNPARQFQLARDSERWSHVSAIVGAITSNITENRGVWTCAGYPTLPTSTTLIANTATSTADICGCIVPSQMATLPADPSGASISDCTGTYNSGYSIIQSTSTRRITVTATPEVGSAISVTQ